jgi:hypothetical protein
VRNVTSEPFIEHTVELEASTLIVTVNAALDVAAGVYVDPVSAWAGAVEVNSKL